PVYTLFWTALLARHHQSTSLITPAHLASTMQDPPGEPQAETDPPDRPRPPDPPDIDSLVSLDHARKVLVHSINNQKLTALHPLIIKKFIIGSIGKPQEIQKLRSGDILFITAEAEQTRKLMALTLFCGVPVTVSTPARWNTVRGTISGPGLQPLTPQDIIDCQDDTDGIIAAKHFQRTNYRTKHRENSNTVLITFHSHRLPSHVYIGLERFPVSRHVPNPLRCYKCQRFGHNTSRCASADQICATCAGVDHDDKHCPNSDAPKCKNCSGPHKAWDRECPFYKTELAINEYRAHNDVSYFEAKKLITSHSEHRTYAQAAAVTRVSSSQQTILSLDPRVDLINFPIINTEAAKVYYTLPNQYKAPPSVSKGTDPIESDSFDNTAPDP
ncbi:unnamed protein product, partial [Meganyctiphanes norvegica]